MTQHTDMVKVKPFKALRPPKDLVEKVESRPYDVLSSEEARVEAAGNPMSLLHIIKPEINFPEGTSEYDPRVYESAVEQFKTFQDNGWLKEDPTECYYLYAQSMGEKTQYGIVVGAAVNDYLRGAIKKHELTRKDKEEDRMKHIRATRANIEPVFLAYRDDAPLLDLISRVAAGTPEYDFIAPIDGFRHRFWVISSAEDISFITERFAQIPELYIADGHHRTAAAALVGKELAEQNPENTGAEEYNYFMAVCFPASQLTILDYNRLLRDLNGRKTYEFLDALTDDFVVIEKGAEEPYKPRRAHEFSLYVSGHWYALEAKDGTYDEDDPIGNLDVDISSRLILDKILGIKDLRTSQRLDFVGGLRGLGELKKRVDSGEMKAALALYPVTMQQIMRIADSGMIMPPKATWFEPKLRSGLVIHKF